LQAQLFLLTGVYYKHPRLQIWSLKKWTFPGNSNPRNTALEELCNNNNNKFKKNTTSHVTFAPQRQLPPIIPQWPKPSTTTTQGCTQDT